MRHYLIVFTVAVALLGAGGAAALPSSGLDPNTLCTPDPDYPMFLPFEGPVTIQGLTFPGTIANYCKHYAELLALLSSNLHGLLDAPLCSDPAFGSFCALLHPCTADINGTIVVDDRGAELEVTVEGNGIQDTANQLGMLTRILNDPTFDNGVLTHQQVLAAYEHNFYQLQCDMGTGTLLPMVGALNLFEISAVVTELVEIIVAHITVGDGDLTVDNSDPLGDVTTASGSWGIAAGLVAVLCPALEGLINDDPNNTIPRPCINPNIQKADYITLEAFLGPEGDADGDGATNRQEALFFQDNACGSLTSMAYGAPTPLSFNCPIPSGVTALDAMLDASIVPPNVTNGLFISGPAFVEEGDNIKLRAISIVPGLDLETATYFQWFKDTDPLGVTDTDLFLNNVTFADSGTYHFDVEDGSKAEVSSKPFTVNVLPQGSVPVGGGLAMGLLAGACALAGAMGIRRKR